jgi:hypothetical protein
MISVGTKVYYKEAPLSIEAMRALNIWTEEALAFAASNWVCKEGEAIVLCVWEANEETGEPAVYDLDLDGEQVTAIESEMEVIER